MALHSSLYTLQREQIFQIKKLNKLIKQHKDDLSDYELMTIHDLLYFISQDKKAFTCNQKLIKMFKDYDVKMTKHELDENIYVLNDGEC